MNFSFLKKTNQGQLNKTIQLPFISHRQFGVCVCVVLQCVGVVVCVWSVVWWLLWHAEKTMCRLQNASVCVGNTSTCFKQPKSLLTLPFSNLLRHLSVLHVFPLATALKITVCTHASLSIIHIYRHIHTHEHLHPHAHTNATHLDICKYKNKFIFMNMYMFM